jgi:excisionase family DNA binding protein
MDGSSQFLTPAQAAELLGINKRHLLQLPVKRLRFGYRTIRILRSDLDAFLQRIASAGGDRQ